MEQRVAALLQRLAPIEFEQYSIGMRKIFTEDLVALADLDPAMWASLEPYVGSYCGMCDYYAHPPWAPKDKKTGIKAVPHLEHCSNKVKDVDHLSRIPDVSRGMARTLLDGSVATVTALSACASDHEVFSEHNRLSAERRLLPLRAEHLLKGTRGLTQRQCATLPRYSHLSAFLVMNFDASTGFTTGMAVYGNYRPHRAFGSQPQPVEETDDPKQRPDAEDGDDRSGDTGAAYATSAPPVQRLTLARELVDASSAEGSRLLAAAAAKTDYGQLEPHFIAQGRRAFCGVASGVMVINAALKRDPPLTQQSLFELATTDAPGRWTVSFRGLTLAQLAGVVRAHGLRVQVVHATPSGIDAFRAVVRSALSEPQTFVVVNYDRAVLAQDGAGHISPLGAYESETDRVLILDVAAHKYPYTWVPVAKLWNAMSTLDAVSGQTRGYLLVMGGAARR